ncbi:hypothetical protein GCM10012278_24040 [Nonomuraea glycinis]|uniref:Uncharacterized protein n=1 Tax=Nonomuraea glycinis TaxID=2047744 RepID=A0A918A431_9ACTN|nr:hypothetical protein GCM10012278_24040 [Nonomuraea glycinis]
MRSWRSTGPKAYAAEVVSGSFIAHRLPRLWCCFFEQRRPSGQAMEMEVTIRTDGYSERKPEGK